MARELTERQKRVLSTLEAYWTEHQVPPSIADLAKELGINKATAYEHLLALKRKGYLSHQARAGRTWRVVNPKHPNLTPANRIPVVGRVAAGIPLLASQNIEEHIIFEGPKSQEIFALRVQGDSMIKAHIQNNDLVIADKNASVHKNDIIVALINNEEATVKRIDKQNNITRLIPENDGFQIQEYETHQVQVLGKVIEVRRRL